MSAQQLASRVHELEVERIELESRNEALRRSEGAYRQLFDNDLTGNFVARPDGTIVLCNAAFARIFDFGSVKDALGANVAELYVPVDGWAERVGRIRRGEQFRRDEGAARRRDGAPLHVVQALVGVFDARGELVELLGYVFDDTARKRMEDELRQRDRVIVDLNASLSRRVRQRTKQLVEERARLQAIVDIAGEGIVTIDEDGCIESINAAGLKMFGYPADEVLGRNVSMLMPSPDREAHDGYLHRYIETAQPRILQATRRVSGRTKNGDVFPVDISVGEMTLGGVRFFIARLRDATERQRLEAQARERLEDAAQLQRIGVAGEMAGVLAHQLNQPLAAILSFAEAGAMRLRRGAVNAAQLVETLGDIAAQAKRASESIRDLRSFLSREADDLTAGDINANVRWVCEMFDVLARDANIALTLDLCEGLPHVMMHNAQIEQVVTNLLDNALDAILAKPPSGAPGRDAAGRIVVRTALAEAERAIVVSVHDTGPGLDERTARKAFEPLFTSKKNGIGLGLSIARSIVSAHGGRIWAEPGPSGSFHFTLPIGAAKP